MQDPGILHAHLRRATETAHVRLETNLDILAQLADRTRRVWLMRRFWGLHRGAETALAPLLADVAGLDYAGRSKLAPLSADLARLTGRVPDDTLPVCPVAVATQGAALGLAYVLEGSALGGRVIRREMIARGEPEAGLTFFDPYGRETGARWRDFLAVLDREAETGGPAVRDAIVQGAVDGFAVTEAWLCGDVAPDDGPADPIRAHRPATRSRAESPVIP